MAHGTVTLGLGTAPIGNLFRRIGNGDALATLDAAWEAGVRLFDTAPYYGFGLAERRLGLFLAGRPRASYALSTKVGRLIHPDRGAPPGEREGFADPPPMAMRYDYSHDGVMRAFEASLQRLGVAEIDLLLAHDLGEMTHGADHARHWRDFWDGGYRAMRALRDSGAVRAIGLGVNELAVCEAALERGAFDRLLIAGRYTLLQQADFARIEALCATAGTRLILGGVFNSGILATGAGAAGEAMFDYAPAERAVIDRVRAIEAIGHAHGVALPAAALRFAATHPLAEALVIGVAGAAEARAGCAAFRAPIPPAYWDDLVAAGLLPRDARARIPD
jgi:D-threo-aldose 1-dehydrogenase